MPDFGIRTSLPGKSVFSDDGATINFNTEHAFIKIDTKNPVGFQTITMLITNDPPEPVSPVQFAYTVLYKFKHGYTYTPSLETLFFVLTPPPGTGFYQPYFQDAGVIGAHTSDDEAAVWAVADATWIYIVCGKYRLAPFGSPNLLSGTNLQITTHVFVEDIGH